MNTAPQELLKEYVQSQHFTSTAEILTAMKEMFRDVVQTVMESDGSGDGRGTGEGALPAYRDIRRAQLPERIHEEGGEDSTGGSRDPGAPGIGTGALSRKSSENTAGTRTVWKRRLSVSTPAGHRGADQRIVRCEDQPGSGDQDHGEDHAGGHGVAKPPFGGGVSPEPFTAVYYPPDPLFHPFRQL